MVCGYGFEPQNPLRRLLRAGRLTSLLPVRQAHAAPLPDFSLDSPMLSVLAPARGRYVNAALLPMRKTRIIAGQENKTGRVDIVMRSMLFAVLLSAAVPFAALAQTNDDLKNDENTPGDVLVYGMGSSGNRFSLLT